MVEKLHEGYATDSRRVKIIDANDTHKKKTSQLNALCLLSIVYVYGEKILSNNFLIKNKTPFALGFGGKNHRSLLETTNQN